MSALRARASVLATLALAVVPATAAASSTDALPAGLSPRVRQAAQNAGQPNPLLQVQLAGATFPGGGVQISDDSIAYANGTVVLVAGSGPVVAAASSARVVRRPRAHAATVYACPNGDFCLYRNNNFDTPSGQTWFYTNAGGGTQIQLSAYNYNDVDSSWANYRAGNVRVHNNWPLGSNDYFTANSGSSSTSLSSTWNDQGSGLSLGS